MNLADLKQQILSSATKALLYLYSVVVYLLIVAIMIKHRAWDLPPRRK